MSDGAGSMWRNPVRGSITRRYSVGCFLAMLLSAACASGAAPDVTGTPPTTTSTALPPPGVAVVVIRDSTFHPPNLRLDLEATWTVVWRNDDVDIDYVVFSTTAEFESEPIAPGEEFSFDFSDLEPDVYRYGTWVGRQRVPGMIDTRPEP